MLNLPFCWPGMPNLPFPVRIGVFEIRWASNLRPDRFIPFISSMHASRNDKFHLFPSMHAHWNGNFHFFEKQNGLQALRDAGKWHHMSNTDFESNMRRQNLTEKYIGRRKKTTYDAKVTCDAKIQHAMPRLVLASDVDIRRWSPTDMRRQTHIYLRRRNRCE